MSLIKLCIKLFHALSGKIEESKLKFIERKENRQFWTNSIRHV